MKKQNRLLALTLALLLALSLTACGAKSNGTAAADAAPMAAGSGQNTMMAMAEDGTAREEALSTDTSTTTAQLPAALAGIFTPAAACGFLAFTLLYTPCVAAIAAVRRELSGRHAAIVVCYQTLVAWLVGFVVYQLCGLFL